MKVLVLLNVIIVGEGLWVKCKILILLFLAAGVKITTGKPQA